MPGEIIATEIEIQRAIDGLRDSSDNLAHAVEHLGGLAKRLQATIPVWVEEFDQSNASDTQVLGSPAVHQLIRITGLLAIVPAGTTSASLTLGDRTISLQNTVTLLSPLSWLIQPSAPRKLTYSPAGIAYLWIWGEQLGESGFLSGGVA